MAQRLPRAADSGRTFRQYLRESVLTGTAVVLPVLLTVVVLFVGLNFLAGLLDPIALPIHRFLGRPGRPDLFATVLAAVVLGVLIVGLGALAENDRVGDLEGAVNAAMARVPGISTIHGTLNQISEMLVESDTDSFQEVVLVEYPGEGSYSVAFKTAEPPDCIVEAAVGESGQEEMMTVFMPMGPNPVMGGFILHITADRVHDVDLSVEEGITSVVSFGVAIEREGTPENVDLQR
jgi:uncharacterized membrane protein